MKLGPGHEMPAGGGLRACHTEREQAVEVLKAAFVEGRLTKDELDARVGQAFTSRTRAEVAAVTADLPAGLTAVQPLRKPARAPGGAPANTAVRTGVRVIGAATAVTAASWAAALGQANDQAVFMLVWTFTITWLGILILTLAVMLESRRQRRSGGQLPSRGTDSGTSLGY